MEAEATEGLVGGTESPKTEASTIALAGAGTSAETLTGTGISTGTETGTGRSGTEAASAKETEPQACLQSLALWPG